MVEIKKNLIHIAQGQFRVTGAANDVLITVLGSCVAVCLHDPLCRIGGMNHFLLPGSDPATGRNIKYGAHSLEQLVNAMLQAGAHHCRLEAHVFGGASMVKGLGKIGECNANFALDFIRQEGFVLRSEDTGGHSGRRLCFRPVAGEIQVEMLDPTSKDIQQGENPERQAPMPKSSFELF